MKTYPILLFVVLLLFMACSGKSATVGQTNTISVNIPKDTVPVRKGLYLYIAQKKQHLPVNSVIIEIVNNSDTLCLTGEDNHLERKTDKGWERVPFRSTWRGADGKMYAYSIRDIGYGVLPGDTLKLTAPLVSDDPLKPGEYRIGQKVRFEGTPLTDEFYIYDNFYIIDN